MVTHFISELTFRSIAEANRTHDPSLYLFLSVKDKVMHAAQTDTTRDKYRGICVGDNAKGVA